MPTEPPEPPQPSGSEELVQAKIRVENLEAATAQSEVLAAVEALAGIRTVSFDDGTLEVVYDPLRTTEKEIERAVTGAGHRPQCADEERDSPFADLDR